MSQVYIGILACLGVIVFIFYLPFQPLSGEIQMAVAYFLAVSPAGQGWLLESSQWLCRLNNSIFRAFVSVLEVIAL